MGTLNFAVIQALSDLIEQVPPGLTQFGMTAYWPFDKSYDDIVGQNDGTVSQGGGTVASDTLDSSRGTLKLDGNTVVDVGQDQTFKHQLIHGLPGLNWIQAHPVGLQSLVLGRPKCGYI